MVLFILFKCWSRHRVVLTSWTPACSQPWKEGTIVLRLLGLVVFKQVVSISLISLSGCVMAGCALVDLGEKETWVRSDWVHASDWLH